MAQRCSALFIRLCSDTDMAQCNECSCKVICLVWLDDVMLPKSALSQTESLSPHNCDW